MELFHTHVAGTFEARNIEDPSSSVDAFEDDAFYDSTYGKVRVNHRTAQNYAPWWQALNVLSGDVAQLPLIVYKRIEPTGKNRDESHPAYRLLHRTPNPEMGPFRFKQLMMMQALSMGNAYAFIEKRGLTPIALWPLDIGTVVPVRENGKLHYHYNPPNGRQEILDRSEVLHLAGPGDEGWGGRSVVSLASESLSVGMQAQRFGSKFFENDARPGITLEFPEAVDSETAKNILRFWDKRHQGSSRSNRPGFLDRGGKVKPFSMSNEDAQFLQTREFSRSEVASWFILPPHKVGDLTHATFSNIEQQSIDYVVYSLMPWLVRFQDECNAKLFTEQEIRADTHFCEFMPDALLRGDYSSRMAGHVQAITNGILNIDEIRAIENRNPLPDGLGQTHYVPMNVSEVGREDDIEPTNADEIARVAVAAAVRRAYQRIGKLATRSAVSPGKLQVWRDASLSDERDKLTGEITPICELAGLCAEEISEEVAASIRNLIDIELDSESSEPIKSRVESATKSLTASEE